MSDLEQATLRNIADGELEEKFQAHLKEVVPVFADPRPYVQDKDGRTKVKILLEVEMLQDSEGLIAMHVHTELKRPKRKSAGGFLHRRGEKFLVSESPQQGPLFDRPKLATVPLGEGKQ